LNPGRNSWKIKGDKKKISLSSNSNSKGKNSRLRKSSFTLKRKNGQQEKKIIKDSVRRESLRVSLEILRSALLGFSPNHYSLGTMGYDRQGYDRYLTMELN
jgi:hypothetical protein